MARRRNYAPAVEAPPAPEMVALMEEALTAPGRMGDTFNRFHRYSFGNQLWLMMQGAKEPVASYKRWQALGRQVKRGESGLYVLRPITVKSKTELDEDGKPVTYTKFKPVKGAFTYSQTEGETLPEPEPREWSRERALAALSINMVPFQMIDGNVQGYSYDRNIAINPVAAEPQPTFAHEMFHILHGHTVKALGSAALTADMLTPHDEGLGEFEAEGASYLFCNELEIPFNKAGSRAYLQTWLSRSALVSTDVRPPDSSLRKVFKNVDVALNAGYEPQEQELGVTA